MEYELTALDQVTSSSVRLVSSETRELLSNWDAPDGLNLNIVTANARQVCPNSTLVTHITCFLNNQLILLVRFFWQVKIICFTSKLEMGN